CPFTGQGDLPGDQRWDDAGSLTFDSAPLAVPLEILGAPRVVLTVAADRPQAMVAVRLCDVAPDGASLRVTYGLLNLARREGGRPVVPGEPMGVEIALNPIAHRFPAGHRLRVAISTGYWPLAWPAPEPVTLSVSHGR